MSLATRLKKLEVPIKQAWEEAWADYMEAVLDICPKEARTACLNLYLCLDAAGRDEAKRRLPTLLTHLSLDAEAWCAWLGARAWSSSGWGWTYLPHNQALPPEGDLAGALLRVTSWHYEGKEGAARAYLVLSLHEAVVLRERYG